MGWYEIILAINLNLSNLTSYGIFRAAFDPYYSIFGEFTWGIILGFIGAALYINERSVATIMGYLILVGFFTSIIFPSHVIVIFGILLSFILATVFYNAFMGD